MADDNEPPFTNIDPEGDAILAVGEPVQAKLRISSAILSRTSKVFAALFSPRYIEGHDLYAMARPKTIKLPEDEAEPMSDMCKLLHCEDTNIHEGGATNPCRIFAFAVAVDKYDCVKALRPQIQGILLGWLDSDREVKASGVEHGEMLAAAYLLDHKRAFGITTQKLMRKWNGRFSSWQASPTTSPRGDILCRLPVEALLAMEERRSSAWRLLTHDSLSRTWARCYNCLDLLQYSTTANTIMNVFGIHPWPLRFDPQNSQTIASVLESLERQPDVKDVTIHCDCGTESTFQVTRGEIYQLVDETLALTEGLCLTCVQEGSLCVATCSREEHARTGAEKALFDSSKKRWLDDGTEHGDDAA